MEKRVNDKSKIVINFGKHNIHVGIHYLINILFLLAARPVINIPENFNSAPLGTPTTLGCSARGTPEPLITWTKENGDLPRYAKKKNYSLF